ncbi:MAG: hypothetical protein EOP88_07110 [Verrucomicrobiaceae bacterium]|nr:MAG: hypothetical protein EOP88_07110 [Verrucomicrobiaceae bacterium]
MKGLHLLLPLGCVAAAVMLIDPDAHERESVHSATKSRLRERSGAPAFWNSAVAPEPAAFREPSAAVAASPPSAPVDHREEVTRLIKEGDTEGMNREVAAWFEAEPESVSEWLGQQESLEVLQPAIGMIAGKLARDGDPSSGLEWAKLLQQGPERDQVFFDIYALAARGWRFGEEELRAAPLPPEKLELLLSGAAGD